MVKRIDPIDPSEYTAVVELWEASVRATHHFLKEEDILFFKPLIFHDYLKAVELHCVRDESGTILGFSGVADHKLEMLFIHPAVRGQGIGKILIEHALEALQVKEVDVNEDNEQAVGFYEHLGFRTMSRSALDGMGKPYPILHMKLAQ